MDATTWIKPEGTPLLQAATDDSDTQTTAAAPFLGAAPAQRLYRSQSIQDQLNRTPRVNPQWGHSLSKSYGGNDWPLPAPNTTNTLAPTTSTIIPSGTRKMSAATENGEKLWADSTAPKKRGPKPKNEPATSRRQQLNRIAQRAHRDRKELYIKNLESEVRRFRQAYTSCLSDYKKVVEENRLLREEVNAFRSMSGLPSEDVVMTQAQFSLPPPQPFQHTPTSFAPSPSPQISSEASTASPKGLSRMFSKLKRKESQSGIRISPPLQSLNEFERLDITGHTRQGSHTHGFPPSPPNGSQSSDSSPPHSGHTRSISTATVSTLQSQGMEQPLAAVALQFIVRLEAVCLDHLHAAHASDQDPESAPHGHALMGSAVNYMSPPSATTTPPSSYGSSSASPGGLTLDQRMLEVLLNLNFQTNNGEYVNTMGGQIYGSISVLDAWNLVAAHHNFGKFDVEAVANRLASQVVCRGYGPTIDAEEVFKAIDEVCSGQIYGRI